MPEYLLLLLLLRYPEFEYPDPGPSEFDSEAKAEHGREKKLEEKKKVTSFNISETVHLFLVISCISQATKDRPGLKLLTQHETRPV